MTDLSTEYMGLRLKYPIIVGSCSLTGTPGTIRQLEESGAGAIVLKSIFEEEIMPSVESIQLNDFDAKADVKSGKHELRKKLIHSAGSDKATEYLNLIKEVKKNSGIPVIASINCRTYGEWISFSGDIEKAGADAIELNVCNLPDHKLKSDEKSLEKIIKGVLTEVSVPVAVKLSYMYTNLRETILRVSASGVKGMVLFSKPYFIDVDTNNLSISPGKMLSNREDYVISLKWISMISGAVKCSIVGSNGIHHSNVIIKQLLAGADAVQVVSTLYLNGISYITAMIHEMEQWMLRKGFFSISQFKGKIRTEQAVDPSMYDRAGFMRYYGRIV